MEGRQRGAYGDADVVFSLSFIESVGAGRQEGLLGGAAGEIAEHHSLSDSGSGIDGEGLGGLRTSVGRWWCEFGANFIAWCTVYH